MYEYMYLYYVIEKRTHIYVCVLRLGAPPTGFPLLSPFFSPPSSFFSFKKL